MLDLAHLFIAAAFAQDAVTAAPDATAPAGPGGMPANLMQYLPFVLIFGVFYMLVIRPQQKKLDEQGKMIKALQRGDRIVTTGGIHGKISKLEGDDQLMIEIADGVQIKIERSHVNGLAAKTQPVAAANDEEKK